jgi:hypothetical protein
LPGIPALNVRCTSRSPYSENAISTESPEAGSASLLGAPSLAGHQRSPPLSSEAKCRPSGAKAVSCARANDAEATPIGRSLTLPWASTDPSASPAWKNSRPDAPSNATCALTRRSSLPVTSCTATSFPVSNTRSPLRVRATLVAPAAGKRVRSAADAPSYISAEPPTSAAIVELSADTANAAIGAEVSMLPHGAPPKGERVIDCSPATTTCAASSVSSARPALPVGSLPSTASLSSAWVSTRPLPATTRTWRRSSVNATSAISKSAANPRVRREVRRSRTSHSLPPTRASSTDRRSKRNARCKPAIPSSGKRPWMLPVSTSTTSAS